jgi:hypothetical protein
MRSWMACLLVGGGLVLGWAPLAHAQPAASGGPKLKVLLKNTMGNAFELVKADYALDSGAMTARPAAELPGVNAGNDAVLLDAPTETGPHLLSVELSFVGTGYGVFSYLKGYQFTLRGTHSFTLNRGQEATLTVVTYDKGDMTTELKDRPALRVDAQVRNPAAEAQQEAEKRAAQDAAPADNGLKTADEAYDARIRALEEKANELQARIDRTRGRVGSLQDAVLSGSVQAGATTLVLRNEMGQSFRLREIHVFLDGAAIRDQVDPTGDVLSGRDQFDLFDGRMVPGVHTVNVVLVYQGVGVGVFAYLSDQQFKLRSTHNFTVEQGKRARLKVVAYESGDARTEVKDRPTVRFEDAVENLDSGASKGAPQTPAATP